MHTLETPPIETGPEDQLSPKMHRIICGPASDNYEFRQMQLIAEMCIRENHGVPLTRSMLDDAGNRWADLEHPDSSYSSAWRNFGAGCGSRTRDICLENKNFTVKLIPPCFAILANNLRFENYPLTIQFPSDAFPQLSRRTPLSHQPLSSYLLSLCAGLKFLFPLP